MWYSAGNSLRLARSPVAPNSTRASAGRSRPLEPGRAAGGDGACIGARGPVIGRSLVHPVPATRRVRRAPVSRAVLLIRARLARSSVVSVRSTWPPNPARMADSTLSATSARPRELNRWYNAADSTGVGTPSSIAAAIVQRPSPESDTLPAYAVSCGIGGEGVGREVEQPAGHHAPATPHLGDGGEVEVVAVVLGVDERRGLGVGGVLLAADVGLGEHVEALGVGGHHPVLDAVVDHLHEVPGAARAAVQPAVLGAARWFAAA